MGSDIPQVTIETERHLSHLRSLSAENSRTLPQVPREDPLVSRKQWHLGVFGRHFVHNLLAGVVRV